MSSAITPKLVVGGTAGSGKTTIARESAARCGLSLTEDIDILQSEYSRSFDELIADEDFPFDRALEDAGERVLSGVCDIAVLSPSQARHQRSRGVLLFFSSFPLIKPRDALASMLHAPWGLAHHARYLR